MLKIYEKILRPLLFRFPTETAHEFGLETLKLALRSERAQNFARASFACDRFGELKRFGLSFKNPLGVAAGFDKNGVAVNQLAALGFGFVEVGTVTYKAQAGNEKPRLFRLPEDEALINRLGFNNEGALRIIERLKKINPACVLGVNIGRNKTVENDAAIENYLRSFDLAHSVADYVAVNVSSPNTPNLRELQKAENLEELLSALMTRNAELTKIRNADISTAMNAQTRKQTAETTDVKYQAEFSRRADAHRRRDNGVPILVKIAPDLSDDEIEAIVDICLRLEISGVIAANTTTSRRNLKTNKAEIERIGAGGLSGKPLRNRSNEVVQKIYQHSKGKLPVVGVGGIFSGEDAFEKIAAGASLLQSYTGFVYQGFAFARDVNVGLAKILREKSFRNLDAAVGSNVKI